jgi:hypothetical protein
MPESSEEGYGSKRAVSILMKVGIQYTWKQFPVLHLATIYKLKLKKKTKLHGL